MLKSVNKARKHLVKINIRVRIFHQSMYLVSMGMAAWPIPFLCHILLVILIDGTKLPMWDGVFATLRMRMARIHQAMSFVRDWEECCWKDLIQAVGGITTN